MKARREALIARRELLGYTQETFASAVGVEFTTAGRWVRGEVRPQPWRRKRIAAVLRLSLEEVDKLLTSGAEAAPAQSSGMAIDNAAPDDAHDVAEFVRDIEASRVSDTTLDDLELDITRCSSDYVARPLAGLLAEIRKVRTQAFALVRSSRYPNQLRRLYLEASRASGLQAHASLDLGDYREARTHAHAALLCAELADHRGMQAWVRGVQSLIAYWDNNFSDAVMYARDGARFGASGSVSIRLSGLEARASAALGDASGTLAALDRAERTRSHDQAEDECGVFTFPLAKQVVYAGTALLTLRDPDLAQRAVRQSTRALELYAAAEASDRSSGDILAARLDLASAHLIQDDLDGVQSHLAAVLAVPADRRTASILKRTARIGAQLSRPRHAASRQGQLLRGEVTAFCDADNRPEGLR